ncbi:hypothetical protein F5884DRAFT_798336 [Xylogone sp. PMI_703]|nr:hypothetical protein F5884DRAFT_798336 [Xylogone sp. PMI_703]
MATPRRPLAETSENKTPRKELTPYERGMIAGAAKLGHSPAEISKSLNLPYSTVKATLSRDELRDNGKSQPRSGAPRSYSDRDERSILRFIRHNPKCKYEEIRERCGGSWSDATLKRIFRKNGVSNSRLSVKKAKK